MEALLTFENLAALVTLTALEIVLGIDNIVFIAILTGRLPKNVQAKARRIGLLGAMFVRVALLLCISWIMTLTNTLFSVSEIDISGKDLILIIGGLFLILKATLEIHKKIDHDDEQAAKGSATFHVVIVQIMLLDIVFSLDSVITAVGMVKPEAVAIMITAIIIAVFVMMLFANPISNYVERHPTIKMLALSFLLMIGVLLVADGLHQHISKGYVYFAMAFSLGVELLNIRMRSKRKTKTPEIAGL